MGKAEERERGRMVRRDRVKARDISRGPSMSKRGEVVFLQVEVSTCVCDIPVHV